MRTEAVDVAAHPVLAVLPYEPAAPFGPTSFRTIRLSGRFGFQDDSALADCQGKRIGILIVTYNGALPQFEEYFVHYPRNTPDTRPRFTLAGSGNTVLDIGCGKDFLAAEMTRNGNCVTGIDTLASGEVPPSLERYL